MLTLLLSAVLAGATNVAPAPVPAAAPNLVGPPTLCHALDIGDQRSLPWGRGSFGALPDYDVSKLPADTYDVLLKTDDVYVHMETLRRAAIYGSGAGLSGDAAQKVSRETRVAAAMKLLQELEFDADVHGAEAKAAVEACDTKAGGKAHGDCGDKSKANAPPAHAGVKGTRYLLSPEPPLGGRMCQAQGRNAALCWFDVAYLRSALRAAELDRDAIEDPAPAVRNALALQPGDPRLELGAALCLMDHTDGTRQGEAWQHLDAALKVAENREQAGDEDGRLAAATLRKNLLATVGPLVNAHDDEQLAKAIRERVPSS